MDFFPPGPRPLFWGSLVLRLVLDPLRTMEFIARSYGDIAYFKLGHERLFLLNHPDYIKDVLVSHSQNFIEGRAMQAGRRVIGDGLLTTDGVVHDRQRRLVLPAFNHQHLVSYSKVMVKHCDELTRSYNWRDGMELDICKEMKRLTLEIVGETLFDFNLRSNASEIGDALTTVIKYLVVCALLQEFTQRNPFARKILQRLSRTLPELLEGTPLPASRRFFNASETLNKTIDYVIEREREVSLHRCHQGGNDNDKGESLLSFLLHQVRDVEGLTRADMEVRDIAMTMLLAGHETTANVLAWTWYLLATHQNVEARLHAELDSVLGNRPPAFTDLSSLRYTKSVLREVMRLYPPVWVLGRRVVEEHKLGNYVLPAGSSVLISQYVTHRDPRYFKDPEKFCPERWSEEHMQGINGSRFTYFPFSAGPRSCIGESFAWLESTLLLATIAKGWEMRLVKEHPVVPEPLITLRPKHGVLVKLKRRASTSP